MADVKKMEKKQTKIKLTTVIFILAVVAVLIIAVVIAASKNAQTATGEGSSSSSSSSSSTNEEEQTFTLASYVEVIEDAVQINKSENVDNVSKVVDGLTITETQLTSRNGTTTFFAKVTNETGAATSLKVIEVTLLDQSGAVLTTLTGVIGALANGETTEINLSTTTNYIEAYDFKIAVQ